MRANAGASATSATTLREGDTFAETRAAGAASDAGANRSAGARENPVDDFDDPERRVSRSRSEALEAFSEAFEEERCSAGRTTARPRPGPPPRGRRSARRRAQRRARLLGGEGVRARRRLVRGDGAGAATGNTRRDPAGSDATVADARATRRRKYPVPPGGEEASSESRPSESGPEPAARYLSVTDASGTSSANARSVVDGTGTGPPSGRCSRPARRRFVSSSSLRDASRVRNSRNHASRSNSASPARLRTSDAAGLANDKDPSSGLANEDPSGLANASSTRRAPPSPPPLPPSRSRSPSRSSRSRRSVVRTKNASATSRSASARSASASTVAKLLDANATRTRSRRGGSRAARFASPSQLRRTVTTHRERSERSSGYAPRRRRWPPPPPPRRPRGRAPAPDDDAPTRGFRRRRLLLLRLLLRGAEGGGLQSEPLDDEDRLVRDGRLVIVRASGSSVGVSRVASFSSSLVVFVGGAVVRRGVDAESRGGAPRGVEAHRGVLHAHAHASEDARERAATRSDAEEGAGVGGGDRAGVDAGRVGAGFAAPSFRRSVVVVVVVARGSRPGGVPSSGARARRTPPTSTSTGFAPRACHGTVTRSRPTRAERTRAGIAAFPAARSWSSAARSSAASRISNTPEPSATSSCSASRSSRRNRPSARLSRNLNARRSAHAYAWASIEARGGRREGASGGGDTKKAPGRPSDEPTTGAEVRREESGTARREGSGRAIDARLTRVPSREPPRERARANRASAREGARGASPARIAPRVEMAGATRSREISPSTCRRHHRHCRSSHKLLMRSAAPTRIRGQNLRRRLHSPSRRAPRAFPSTTRRDERHDRAQGGDDVLRVLGRGRARAREDGRRVSTSPPGARASARDPRARAPLFPPATRCAVSRAPR